MAELSRSAVYVILRRGDRVLMILRQNTGYMDGMWDLPAGHVETGEPASAAAVREAMEEVGVALRVDALRFAHTTHRFHGDRSYWGVYFEAAGWSGEPAIMEPDKCAGLGWFDPGALPPNTVPFTRDALVEHIPNGAAYAEWGWERS